MARVQVLADAMRLPVAEVIRRALAAYLARYELQGAEKDGRRPVVMPTSLPGATRRVAGKIEEP